MVMAALRVRLCVRHGLSVSVVLCCLFLFTAMKGQVPLPEITPRVDTLWTRSASASGIIEYQACALGGSTPALVTAVRRDEDSGERRQLLVCYDPATGDSIRTMETGHRSSIRDIAFAAQADLLATADHGTVKLWRWPTMQLLHTITGPSTALPAVLLTRDGERLFSNIDAVMYGTDCADTLWKFITVLEGTKAQPVMTPDDRYIALVRKQYVGARDIGVLLDAANGLPIDVFHGGGGDDAIASIAVSDDARYVAISRMPEHAMPRRQGSCVIYDRQNRDVAGVITLQGDPDTDGMRCRFLPDGNGLILYRNVEGSQPGDYLYPMQGGRPSAVWWPFFEQRFNADWTRQYGANGRHAWVGPFVMPRAGVAMPLTDDQGVVCVDGDQTMHVSGLSMADGMVTIDAITYDGRLCARDETMLRDGACWYRYPVYLRGPVILRITYGNVLLASVRCLIP